MGLLSTHVDEYMYERNMHQNELFLILTFRHTVFAIEYGVVNKQLNLVYRPKKKCIESFFSF